MVQRVRGPGTPVSVPNGGPGQHGRDWGADPWLENALLSAFPWFPAQPRSCEFGQ